MKLNVVIFSIWLSAGIPSWVMGQSVTEAASDTVPTRYEKMMTRRMEGWKRLIPDHYKIQFAGKYRCRFNRYGMDLREEAAVGDRYHVGLFA